MTYRTFDQAFRRICYPAGERHIRTDQLDELRGTTTIEATVRAFDDLADVVVADRILRRNHLAVEWFVPYFPFARHDRRIDAGDGLELEVALELAKQLDIVIADPHSDVSGVLPHIPQESTVEVIRTLGLMADGAVVVIPDAGAAKKAAGWVGGSDAVQALKTRDPRTGALSGFRLIDADVVDRPCLIVDDICDGGGTFLGLADELVAHGAGPLTLIVTHGLFTKGLDRLTRAFDRIITFAPTDDATDSETGGVIRLPFRTLYEKGQRR